ncbi:MAG TPA: hypothetical protein VMD30_05375, partial [Tepidisphaeraceae bacterium]|nr:hypothetical protein [Tepidisphaeraceae bacterium]
GLDDLVGRDEEEYADLAVRLAEDRQRLRELRRTLRQRMKESALMDGAGFTRNLEDAYRRMWRAWAIQ